MKFLFIIQGEGRGHTTQAIALKEIIEERGHTIELAMMGHRGDRPSSVLKEHFNNTLEFESPNLVYKQDGRHVSVFKTMLELILRSPKYIHSLKTIHKQIKKHNPDVIINFYESMFGLYRLLFRPKIKSFAIGHQFMFFHPDYISMKEYPLQTIGAKLFTGLIGYGSTKLALSFYDKPQYKDIHVVPPLLRKKIFEIQPYSGGYALAYCINKTYAYDFISPHPKKMVHVFTETKEEYACTMTHFHPLNGKLFLEMMAGADCIITTAGFETIAEAAYLGKPVYMRPVSGHMEQYFNAKDAETQLGNGKRIQEFSDWTIFKIEMNPNKTSTFKKWVNSYKQRFINILGL